MLTVFTKSKETSDWSDNEIHEGRMKSEDRSLFIDWSKASWPRQSDDFYLGTLQGLAAFTLTLMVTHVTKAGERLEKTNKKT